MATLTPDAARTILRSGDFTPLGGVIETDELEAKSVPYADTNLGRFELAKDVSGLANRGGGIVIIGVRTERFQERQADEIAEVRLLARGLVNPEQYRALIRTWIYPAPQGVEVEWFPSRADQARGLVGIFVPPQSRDAWPHLIANYIDPESGNQRGIVFGLAERLQASVEPSSVRDLHNLIRDGRRFSEVGSRLDRIELAMRRGPAIPQGPAPAASFEARRDEAVQAAKLANSAAVVLAAIPSRPIELPGMFRGPGSPVYELLHHPPRLRDGSFHLAGPAPQIVGENAQRSLGHEVVLELWADGTLIGAGDAADYLCWGTQGPEGSLRLNPLALVEVPYLFVELARRLYALVPHDEPLFGVQFRLSVHRMIVAGHRAILTPWPRGTMGYQFGHDSREAPETDHEFSVVVGDRNFQTGQVTYELMRRFFRWFGFHEDQVLYTRPGPEPVIDPDMIRESGARP